MLNKFSIDRFFEGHSPQNQREKISFVLCYLLRSKPFPSVEQYNGTMAEREKGLISSRHILIYAVNLIRQRGSLYNVSFHSSKLLRKVGSRRIDTRSVACTCRRNVFGQLAQLEFAASTFIRDSSASRVSGTRESLE